MATVTPGKIFTSNEIVTPANLNLLGTPTVALADNEVTAAKISTDAVTTVKLAANAVTAAKLGTNEQKQMCKAWVNFSGLANYVNALGSSGTSFVTTNGSANAVWNIGTVAGPLGVIFYLPTIGGVTGATLGGVNVATGGFQITGINNANQYAIKLLAGPATSSQTVSGNGATSGYTFSSSGIRASYNVNSITKIAVGDYFINFQAPMVDPYYSVTASGYSLTSEVGISIGATFTNSINYAQLRTVLGGSLHDFYSLNVQVFGN